MDLLDLSDGFIMLLGYNTNGLAHHDCYEAVELLATLGYQSVAITIDHGTLNPYGGHFRQRIVQMRRLLEKHQMRSVIETGARFLLDPRLKHEPTLVSPDPAERARRIEMLKHAVDIAKKLESDCVTFFSGIVHDGASEQEALDRLVPGILELTEYADEQQVTLGFEPEPGMLIDSMASYERLVKRIDSPNFQLTMDLGHLHCLGETPIADYLLRWRDRLVNVHIEDMRAGVHDHLMFGEGEMDFVPILATLKKIGYSGGLHVELSRHSHEGPQAAKKAIDFLRPMVEAAESSP